MPSYRPLDEPVSGYSLQELLGEGAFGQVWKAEAPGGVPVAIKITAKLNGIHAIREWQSLQAVKHLTHPNLVNIHGVWLRDDNGHVLSTDEVKAMLPSESPQEEPPRPVTPVAPTPAPAPRRSSGQHRLPRVDPMSSTLKCETLQVSESTSAGPPLDSSRSDTMTPSGTDSPSSQTDSNDSAASGSAAGSAGSAQSRERWARLEGKIPPLELITAMTLGDGTLLDRLRRCQAMGHKGIPRPELMSHLRDAVKGLQYLNDADVQHCDIKPENLLVVGGSVQVCDYGSALRSIYAAEARRLHQEDGTAASFLAPTARAMTNQGYTVQYAAPEQLGAKKIKLHKTTDLYALATTYYALRTGKFPWSDDSDEPIEKLKYDEHFDFGALERINRFSFEGEVLRRALRRDPKHRPQSVSEFYQELERAIGQEAAAEEAARRRRRRIAGWSAVAVLLVALAAAGFYYRDSLPGFFSQRTDRDELSRLLVTDDWDGAMKLVGQSKQLTANEQETATTWKQLTDDLDRHRLEGDLPLVQRASKLPDRLKLPAYLEYLVTRLSGPGSPIGDDLAQSRPAAAAERATALAGNLPKSVNLPLQQKILNTWLAVPRSKEPAIAAEQLVQMAEALPEVREHVREPLVTTLRAGVASAESTLDSSAAEIANLPAQCVQLANTSQQYVALTSDKVDEELSELATKAQVARLAALVQDPAKRETVAAEAPKVSEAIAAQQPSDATLAPKVELIALAADSNASLDLARIARLADLGPRLKVQATAASWDAKLYRQQVDGTLDKAAASLDQPNSELSSELLASLRTLPSEGSTDLRLAKALVARASAGGKESAAYARAAEWLQNTSSTQQTQLDVRGLAALSQWHALAGDRWWDPDQLQTTLTALREWRAGADQVPLADEVAEQLQRDIAARADRLAANDPAAFASITARIQEKIDEIARSGANDRSSVQASFWRMSADLHAQRARMIALASGTTEELLSAQQELKGIAEAQVALSAAGFKEPPQDAELAALAIECYLTSQRPSENAELPLEVGAAWKVVQSALYAPAGSEINGDGDYLRYVEQLALAAGLKRDPSIAATSEPTPLRPDTKSPWLSTPLRRQSLASALVETAIQQFPPLPPSLKYQDDTTGSQFATSAKTLEQARAWNEKGGAVTGLLAICDMYAKAAPDNWQAIGELTTLATSDSRSLAALDAREPKYLRMHVWLAHARALAATAGDNADRKLAAAVAYAEALRAGEFDPYGQRGFFHDRESALACYAEIIRSGLALLPGDAKPLAGNPRAAEVALLYGAQGAMLEGQFWGPIANQHFGYPTDLLAYERAARDAFATAAAFESDESLGLRWRAGEARAADSLMSSDDEVEKNYERLTNLAAATSSNPAWKETFESHNLQALVHHYESRRVADPVKVSAALAAASQELDLALAAHENHARKGTPWVDSWLAQAHEEQSRVALERAWPANWKERLALLKQSVQHAEAAARVPEEHRLAPASCYFCAGNTYEDFALYLRFYGYFKPAEAAFEEASRVALADPIWQYKANVYLGRLWVKQCIADPQTSGNPSVRDRLRDQAIQRLTKASADLRSLSRPQLFFAREADFHIAEAERELFLKKPGDSRSADPEKLRSAENRFLALADEANLAADKQMNNLIEAAYTAKVSTDPEAKSRLEKYLARVESLLKTHNDAVRRSDVVQLRFWLIDPTNNKPELFADKARIAEEHLAALEGATGPIATDAKKKIMLLVGRADCRGESFVAREGMLDRCEDMLIKSGLSPVALEERQIEVLTARQIMHWQQAALPAADDAAKARHAKESIDAAEEVVRRAKQLVAEHQITLTLGPSDEPPNTRTEKRQRFDPLALTNEARIHSVYAAAAAALLAQNAELKREINAKVKQLWDDVGLDKIAPENGGPNAQQQRMFLKYTMAP